MNCYGLTDSEWSVIEPLLPNKPRGAAEYRDRLSPEVPGLTPDD